MTDEVTVQKRNVSSQVRRGHSTEEEVPSQVTRGQARSECRGERGSAPIGSQRTDEVTVQRREVSSHVT